MGKVVAAELIGTFWLVFGGCGSAVLAAAFPDVGIGLLGVSLAFGLTVLTMAYTIGHISGCHLNPAVSIGLAVAGRFKPANLLPYIAAQVAGAVLAAGVLYVIASGQPGFSLAGGLASNGYAEHSPGGYSLAAGITSEIVLTMMFLFIILGSTDDRAPRGFAPLAIGLGLTLIHLIGIPVTNLSVNPARSTGPAVFVGGWALAQLWMFWVAPIAGAVLGALAYGGGGGPGDGSGARPAPGARGRRQELDGADIRIGLERLLDDRDQIVREAMLQDERARAELERPLSEGLVVGGGDEHDLAEGQCRLDAAARLEAVHRRQVQVEHGHVRPQAHCRVDDREAIGHAPDDVAERGEQPAQRDEKRLVVFGQQDPRARLAFQ